MVKENREKKQVEHPRFLGFVTLRFWCSLLQFWRSSEEHFISLHKVSQAVVTSLCVAVPGVCSHWADGAFFFSFPPEEAQSSIPPLPYLFSSFTFPHLSHSLLSCSLSLLWESTHNALWGNCPIMNTTLLNLNGASGSVQIGRWNIHKALITLLFLADALCALTVGDNHAVPLGCTVYGKSLTIRTVGCNLSLLPFLSVYI